MKKRNALFLSVTIFVYFMTMGVLEAQGKTPVLLFSDLESGPKTSWEGSATKGAAVTVWGKNFGSSRGNSYITANGAQLTSDSDYAEWGAIGPSRGLERITFWLNNNCQDGVGTISVTINSITSNTLPFTVRSGNIYFIAKDGNDNNNGQYASAQGGSDGPWLSFYKTHGQKNTVLQGGDVIYIREGTYNDIDEQSRMIYLRGLVYQEGRPLAVVGYPGEWPILGTTISGGVWSRPYVNAYLEWHKLIWENSNYAFEVSGHHFRLAGNIFRDNTGGGGGVVKCNNVWGWEIYGNLWQNTGYDSWKHGIYMTGELWTIPGLDHAVENMDVGWNEFDHYIGDAQYPSRVGGGIVEIKSKDNPDWTNNIFVHDNLFHECTASPMWVTESCYNIYFYNNVMWDNLPFTQGSSRGGVKIGTRNADDRFYIYNNTFYDIGSDGSVGSDIAHIQISGGSRVQSKNNIFYSIDDQPYLRIETNNGATFTSENDLYYGNGAPPSGTGITVTKPITEDPQFVDLANHDFHLRSASPAIDGGTSGVSSIVTTDYDNNSRPQYSGYDIGAYEYEYTVYPPTNLRIK